MRELLEAHRDYMRQYWHWALTCGTRYSGPPALPVHRDIQEDAKRFSGEA